MKRYLRGVERVTFQVDMSKVNLESMKGWIAKEINSILGFEDDVLIDMIYNLLSLDEVWQACQADFQKVDPKHIEVTLIPFLERSAIGFTEKLWSLLLSAQKDPLGIPQEFVEQRMEELKKQKVALLAFLRILGKGSPHEGENRFFDSREQSDRV